MHSAGELNWQVDRSSTRKHAQSRQCLAHSFLVPDSTVFGRSDRSSIGGHIISKSARQVTQEIASALCRFRPQWTPHKAQPKRRIDYPPHRIVHVDTILYIFINSNNICIWRRHKTPQFNTLRSQIISSSRSSNNMSECAQRVNIEIYPFGGTIYTSQIAQTWSIIFMISGGNDRHSFTRPARELPMSTQTRPGLVCSFSASPTVQFG